MATDLDSEVVSLRSALAESQRSRDEATFRLDQFVQTQHRKDQEAEHHLRNFLSVIRAITRRTAEEAEDVDGYCALLDGRLAAYMHVHASLAASRSYGSDLASLAAEELLRFTLHEGDKIELAGPPVRLSAEAAGLMVLAFHELVSGWVFSGRSDDPANSLRVNWTLGADEGAQILLIDWTEEGADASARASPWMAWIDQAIKHQLGGSTSQQMTRATWSQQFRLPASAYTAELASAE